MTGLRFATVDLLPPDPEPGTIYFVRRNDGEMDTYVTSKAGVAVLQRAGNVQMHMEALPPGLLPADAPFGRYYATEALELLQLLSGFRADVAATNESVIRLMNAGDVVATATFLPGEEEAVIEVIEPAVPAKSLLIPRTPIVMDPTLAGVVGTFVARRT